ncbi:PAS domain-containing protein [Streptomyces sp. NPDC005438]|uniref:hybrid sensor histidine kinase/response regulator n=1 Tax=Streptomyces sp. NPDC005438 TaxID=3156880 RepID=UPI0033AF8B97
MSSRPPRGTARLAAILDALPDALLLVNCNGTVVNANTIALETFETPGTALVGRGLLSLLPDFDPNRIPGSMRRPEEAGTGRTKPKRMVARRTDGSEFPVEVTSANLEDGRTPYASAFEAAWADHPGGRNQYTGDELLMLVVRDLTGTLDTEDELARQQRQTELILRAASEGIVGVDTHGKIVLVNPSAAQILGYRAGDLGGQELHPLLHHSREDGSPLPYEETPLCDTLRSGRKHRVRVGQVLWGKDGRPVPVDMTTAPMRDGEQLVGAVLTFADRRALRELTDRHRQLMAVIDEGLRGPLERLRAELGGLAADPAGQLWPEANQILHHLAAGYSRMTSLVDNVLAYQRLDAGREKLRRERVSMDAVVSAGVEGAVELIGPGRVQFAVHAPPIEAEVDAERLSTALSHLIADVAGVDATGAGTLGADSTIVVAAAQRGGEDGVVRIEVRGPHAGGHPVHEPLVRGIVRRHGGVLQTHEVPGSMGGSAYVLEVPVSAGGTRPALTGARDHETTVMPAPAQPVRGTEEAPGAEGSPAAAHGAWTGDGSEDPGTPTGTAAPSEGMGVPHGPFPGPAPAPTAMTPAVGSLPAVPETPQAPQAPQTPQAPQAPSGNGVQEGVDVSGASALRPVRPQPSGRRRARPAPEAPAAQAPSQTPEGQGYEGGDRQRAALPAGPGTAPGLAPQPGTPTPAAGTPGHAPGQDTSQAPGHDDDATGGGRRARRALASPEPRQSDTPGAGTPNGAGQDTGTPTPTGTAAQNGQPPSWNGESTGGPASSEAPEATPRPGTGRRARRAAPAEGADATGAGQGSAAPVADPEPSLVDTPPRPGSRRARRLARAAAQARANAEATPSEGTPTGTDGAGTPYGTDGAGTPYATPPSGTPTTPQGTDGTGSPYGSDGAGTPYGTDGAGQPSPEAQPQEDSPGAVPRPRGALTDAGPLPPVGPPAPGATEAHPHGATPTPPPGQPLGEQGQFGAGPQPAPPPAAPGPQPGPLPQPRTTGEDQGEPLPRIQLPDEHGEFGEGPEAAPQALPPEEGDQPAEEGQGEPEPAPVLPPRVAASPILGGGPIPEELTRRRSLPLPGSEQRQEPSGISVRTLGHGAPYARQLGEHGGTPYSASAPGTAIPSTPSSPPGTPGGGRRRKLGSREEQPAPEGAAPAPPSAPPRPTAPPPARPRREGPPAQEFSVGAPGGAEGPEPLDGPDSPVAVSQRADQPPRADDELPPEPLDNPRRLLVWPEPDGSTRSALTERGYRPVIVNSREEVDAQISAYPAALFVDPLTGPITRTALQSLRTAAVAAEVPVLVTAGLGHASREAAYGADPAVLLKALAPRDSEQHPPRVLLVEENPAIAEAFIATLERRGMQAAHAPSDREAMNVASQIHPNLVVMDLMQVRRRRSGLIDWLRVNGLLARTPFVVYTSAGMDPAQLPRLTSGETVLFLAERSTSQEVQGRIVDLLTKIGAH